MQFVMKKIFVNAQVATLDRILKVIWFVWTVLQDAKDVTSDEIDEFGFFALEDVGPGSYSLHVELSSIVIPIENFTIKLGTS